MSSTEDAHEPAGASGWSNRSSSFDHVFEFLCRRSLPEDCLRHVGISREDALALEALIASARPRRALEVGTFVGLSTGVIASALLPNGTLVCVDPGLRVRHHQLVGSGCGGLDRDEPCTEHVEAVLEHLGRRQNALLLQGFFSTRPGAPIADRLHDAGVNLDDIPVVGEVCVGLGPFDFVFLDGDHSERGVAADLELAARCVARDGLIAVHDIEGDWRAGPRAAIDAFLAQRPAFRLECRGDVGVLSRMPGARSSS